MSIDRRQFKRFETLLIVEINPQKEEASYFFGITRNVSFEGFIFESQNYNLQPRDILEFRLKHPKNELSVSVIGEIVWNREMKFECLSGVKFHRLDNETRNKLSELISADAGEHSAHGPLSDGIGIPEKQNGGEEPHHEEGEDVLSDVIDHAVTQFGSDRNGNDDIGSEEPVPQNGRESEGLLSDRPPGREGPVETGEKSGPGAEAPEALKIQNNIAGATHSFATARKKRRRRRSSSMTVAAVFFGLVFSSLLVIFLSHDVREKVMPLLNHTLLEISSLINRNNDMPVPDETGGTETGMLRADQLESLPGNDEKTSDEEEYTGTGTSFDKELDGYLASIESDETDIKPDDHPLSRPDALVQEVSVPSAGESGAEIHEAAPVKTGLPDVEEEKGLQPVKGGDLDETNTDISGGALPDSNKEPLEERTAPVNEASQPSGQSVKERKPEIPAAASDKTVVKKELHQEMTKTMLSKGESKANKEPTLEKDSAARQERIAPQKQATAAEKGLQDKKSVSKQNNKDQTGGAQIANDLSRSKDLTKSRAVKTVKKPEVVALKDEPPVKVETPVKDESVIQKVSESARMTPVQSVLATKDASHAGPSESVAGKNGPEQRAPLNRPEPGKTGSDAPPEREQSKKSGSDASPKIALVLESPRVNIAEVQKRPEMSDAYLKRYFAMYMDPFDDNSNKWDLFDIGAASARIEGGSYHIENKREKGTLIVLHYQRFPHESDFVIETAVRAIEGLDKISYGFIFGAKDARDNYSFQIRENKYYAVQNYNNGIPFTLTSGEIKDSFVEKNSVAVLKIVKQNVGIKFYVNDVYKTEVSNIEFYGNQIGFIVQGKSHIAIDYTRSYVRNADRGQTR